MNEYITEAEHIENDWNYEDLETDEKMVREDILDDRQKRLLRLVGTYVITCIGKSSGKQIYLQDQRISKDGYWTQYLSNALGFLSLKAARAECSKFEFNNPRVAMVGKDYIPIGWY